MVFILDQALRRTLTGTSGRHSMYDYICWEYLVGKAVSPCVFTEEDLGNYHPGDNNVRENEAGTNPDLARVQYDRIVSRWCRSRRPHS